MRLIDADALEQTDRPIEKLMMFGGEYVYTQTEIDLAPTIDAVPVVRCDHCRYCTEHYDTDGNVPYWTCSEWDSGTDADGYCYYGKRKDGINNAFN